MRRYIIFPVWAYVRKTLEDEQRLLKDLRIEFEYNERTGKIIMFERLSRSVQLEGTGLLGHMRECDRLQKGYDEECEPIRVYVYEVVQGQRFVPVYAGGQLRPVDAEVRAIIDAEYQAHRRKSK